jgi:hypothetical protein
MSTMSYWQVDLDRLGRSAVASETTTSFLADSVALNTERRRLPESYPASIPASQAYYWTGTWQAGEREALEEIRLGQSRFFTDPRAAVRWLLSPED